MMRTLMLALLLISCGGEREDRSFPLPMLYGRCETSHATGFATGHVTVTEASCYFNGAAYRCEATGTQTICRRVKDDRN